MADDPTTPDSALALDIKEALSDGAGPEVLAVTIGNVPPGAALSAGADNGDGTWSLDMADLDGLTITPPPGWSGEIDLTVSALSKSGDAAAQPTTTAFGFTVTPPGAEAPPVPEPSPAPEPEAPPVPEPPLGPAVEPSSIALEIDTALGEGEAGEEAGDAAVIISGVPPGAVLSAGSESGGGIWTLTPADLPGLQIRPTADTGGDFILGIAVTRGGEIVTSGSLVVTVDSSLPAVPDAVSEPGPEPEPSPTADPESAPAPEIESPDGAPPNAPPNAQGPAPAAYWKLDETAPGRAADEIGPHHGLTHGDGDEDAPGPFDAVASFDGVDDCLEIPHAEALVSAEGALTIWFNAFAAGRGTLAAKGGKGLDLHIDNGRLVFVMSGPEGRLEVDAGSFGANEWHQATVTWGSAGMRAYQNGQLIASDGFAGGLAGNSAPWIFGAADAAAPGDEARALSDFFHGELDDIAVYTRQLTDAEVRDLSQFGVDGLMTGMTPADMDSSLDLGAIPAEADGPESLATVDAMPVSEPVSDPAPPIDPEPAAEPPPPLIDPVPDEPASPESSGDVDSGLDLDAIPAEEEGPESLATVDADAGAPEDPPGDPEAEEPETAEPVPDAAPEPPQEIPGEIQAEEEGGDVFVFGAGEGGDYAPGADGWSESAAPEEDADGEAITVGEGDELTIESSEKLEW